MMKLDIKNFRSIKDQSVELAPITVLYGPNGSGKSSLLYALLVMQNLVSNQTGDSESHFNLKFTNLGGFSAVVHAHKNSNKIVSCVSFSEQNCFVEWRAEISKSDVFINLRIQDENCHTTFRPCIHLSNPLNSKKYNTQVIEGSSLEFVWNGIEATVRPIHQDNAETRKAAKKLKAVAETPVMLLRNVCVAPMQAGFSKPRFPEVEGSPSLFDEDAIGTILAKQPYLESIISGYLEEITGREFRVHSRSQDNSISLEVTDRSVADYRSRVPTEIVNDGFGINRIAWLLACTLFNKTTWMCIEEPETHLHPSSVRKLAKAFVGIMRNEDKRFLLTTHSEVLVLALLSEVARSNIKPEEVAFYLTTKEGKETKFERQEINKHGQIEGGLTSFMEGELEDLAVLFGETN